MIIQAQGPEQIERLLMMEGLWEGMLEEDSSLEPNLTHWYLAIIDNEEIVGLAIAQWLGNNLVTWHFGLRKKFRGKGTEKYGKEVIQVMKERFPDLQHITMVPGDKPLAKRYAERVGFKLEYTIPKCVCRNGKIYDKHIMRIN